MKVILFEDLKADNLLPITYTRPAWDIFCGALTLHQAIGRFFPKSLVIGVCRKYLQALYPTVGWSFDKKEDLLLLNGRLIPSIKAILKIKKICELKKDALITNGQEIVGCYLSTASFTTHDKKIKALDDTSTAKFLAGLSLPKKNLDWPMFEYCWQTVVYNQKLLSENLSYLKKDFRQIKSGVYVGQKVKIASSAILNVTKGPIVIDDETEILPFTYLVGPLYLGKKCLVKEFATLKDNCCFGPVCKLGGEIEATVMQGYSNKQHYGFLGHSFIGAWVNIAAGTCNSDLKNTYTFVRINGVDTQQQFLGTVIGDYSKTAINTSIFTGRIIGTNCFVYGTITKDIISFTNYAAHLGCVIELPLEVAVKSQKAMFGRRQIKQSEADIKLLTELYNQTKKSRQKEKIKPGQLIFKI